MKSTSVRTIKTARVFKIANAEDEATGDAYDVFKFRKVLGDTGTVQISREVARKAGEVERLLLRKNADVRSGQVQRACNEAPREYRLHAAHVGWRPGFRQFVLRDCVIGGTAQRRKLVPPLWLNEKQQGSVSQSRNSSASGDSEVRTWIDTVAKPAVYSRPLRLILSACCAAPLVSMSGLQPFGINLYGPSKAGKTTALLAGTSMLGLGRESHLPHWNSSTASLQESARVFNDLPLAINEVGLIGGRRADVYPVIRELVYVFAEGRDRGRHSTSLAAAMGSSASWRGIFMSTAEFSFDEYAHRAGEARAPGEYARCLDVQAVSRKRKTIFDRYPKGIKIRERGRWAKRHLIAIRRACEGATGSVLRKYLRFVVANSKQVGETVAACIEEFERSCDLDSLDGALQHAARNMGLVYAGGCIGIQAGILPWKRKALFEAVQSCWNSALVAIEGHEDALASAKTIFWRKLKSLDLPPGNKLKRSKAPVDGFTLQEDGTVTYVINAAVFDKWFDNQAQRTKIIEWLDETGALTRRQTRAGGTPKRAGLEWARIDRRWPNGRRVSSYVFSAPLVQT